MTEELKQKAEEWRKNYKPLGITRIERACIEVETQAKPTKIIENPNPFRITDGWYELYLKDLENAYIAGATENGIWHDLRKDPNDLPKDSEYKTCLYKGGKVSAWYDKEYDCWSSEFNGFEHCIPKSVIYAWCEIPQFKE